MEKDKCCDIGIIRYLSDCGTNFCIALSICVRRTIEFSLLGVDSAPACPCCITDVLQKVSANCMVIIFGRFGGVVPDLSEWSAADMSVLISV